MAVEVRVFTVSVPKGGTALHPQVFPLTMPVRELDGVEIYVPAGANGQLAFALGSGGTAMLPSNPGAYLIANDEVIRWPLEHQIDSGAWQLLAYNTGASPHLIHIRFLLTPPGMDKPPAGMGWIDALTIEFPGGGSSGDGGQPPGGGASFSFALEKPLAVLSAPKGGAGTIPLLIDEVGTRPGNYSIAFSGVAVGITLNAVVGDTPTALTIAATVASSVAVQSYTATVTVSNGGITNTATLTIKVSAASGGGGGGGGGGQAATLSASPNPVVAGANLVVVGAFFGNQEKVTVALGSASWTVVADAGGNFSPSLLVPATLTPGSYALTATGPQHTVTGPTITVNAPAAPPATLSASPNPVVAGNPIVAVGTNFAAGEAVTLFLSSATWAATASASGSFAVSLLIPTGLTPGNYVLSAVGAKNSAVGPTITVSAPPVPTLAVGSLSITAGDVLAFSGAGWGPNTQVTITFLGSSGVVYADGNGSFSNQWNVPTATPAGTYAMVATAGTNTATVAGIAIAQWKGTRNNPIVVQVDGGYHSVPVGATVEFDCNGPRSDVMTLVVPNGNGVFSGGDNGTGVYKFRVDPAYITTANAGVWQVLGTLDHPNSFTASVTLTIA